MKKKIPIVCIGSGWVVSHRHIPALIKCGRYEITGIVGQQVQFLESVAKKYIIPNIFKGDATKNIDWLDHCDAVMIGADPMSHYKLVKFCLENNKHVLVEKPFTLSINQSKKLVALAKDKHLKLSIVHNFQFSDSALKLDKDIKQGKLGAIRGLHAMQLGNSKRRLPIWYEDLPWGLFFDESPHLLYLLEKYGKGVKLISSSKVDSTSGLQTPALVNAIFKTGSGVPASLYLNFEASLSEWYLLIYGDKRLGILDIFRDIYFSLPNDNGHKSLDIIQTSGLTIGGHLLGTLISGVKELKKDHLYGNDVVATEFADYIQNNQKPKGISPENALHVNQLQFEIIIKANKGV